MEITTTFLDNGYIIHNEHQITVELNNKLVLYEVENMEEFVNQIKKSTI